MTTQATYYIIRALVALVAIPFHEPATRWQHGFWRCHRQTRGASFAEPLCAL